MEQELFDLIQSAAMFIPKNERDESAAIAIDRAWRTGIRSMDDVAPNPAGWARRAVVNAQRDVLRNGRRRIALAGDLKATKSLVEDDSFTRHDQELIEAVRTYAILSINDVPEVWRSSLLAVDIEGDEYGEAAIRLGLPAGTVRSRAMRGREALDDFGRGAVSVWRTMELGRVPLASLAERTKVHNQLLKDGWLE